MARRAKRWRLREDYRPLLKRVKKLFPNVLAHVKTKRIALVGMEGKTAAFMAKIYGNRYPWSLLAKDYDYAIVFHSTRFDTKKKSYRLWIVRHELAHVPPGGFTFGHPAYRQLIKHDIEDFKFLRKTYGLNLEHVKKIYKGEEAEA
jgi:predicted metallopeptidase